MATIATISKLAASLDGNGRTGQVHRRLSREESRALTRTRLITVGRAHFLRNGLGFSVAEKIAEEAGYSRGALYFNFTGKEDLFLAVMQQEHERHCEAYAAISREMAEPKTLLTKLRAAYVSMLVDPDWVILWADFQSEAVRSKVMRERYREFHVQMVQDAIAILTGHIERGTLVCSMEPAHFVLAISSFAHGLAIRQHLLGAKLPETTTRKLVGELFDTLIHNP